MTALSIKRALSEKSEIRVKFSRSIAADPETEEGLMNLLKAYVSEPPERLTEILSDLSSFCSNLKLI